MSCSTLHLAFFNPFIHSVGQPLTPETSLAHGLCQAWHSGLGD